MPVCMPADRLQASVSNVKHKIHLLAKSMNAVLPHSIVVCEAAEVPIDFNARYDAKNRRYTILYQPSADRNSYATTAGRYSRR